MTQTTNTIEVELDSRQRLPLARIIQDGQHRFRVITLPSGEYLVSPIVSVSERELAMLRNPEARASLNEGLEQAAKGDVTHREPGYYEKLADELGTDND
jgi:hypothetical protein